MLNDVTSLRSFRDTIPGAETRGKTPKKIYTAPTRRSTVSHNHRHFTLSFLTGPARFQLCSGPRAVKLCAAVVQRRSDIGWGRRRRRPSDSTDIPGPRRCPALRSGVRSAGSGSRRGPVCQTNLVKSTGNGIYGRAGNSVA